MEAEEHVRLFYVVSITFTSSLVFPLLHEFKVIKYTLVVCVCALYYRIAQQQAYLSV